MATPLLVLAGVALAPWWLDAQTWERVIHSEHGVLEWMTVLMLLPAVAACGWIAAKSGGPGEKAWPITARLWFGVLAVGLFYFAGEEASWGQHALGFTPPASIAEGNLQGEFNLHNADAWYHDLLNEIPRTLASLFCVVVAGVLPWWNPRNRHSQNRVHQTGPAAPSRPRKRPRWWAWLVPGRSLIVTGLAVGLVSLAEIPFEDTALDQPGRWVYYALTEIDDELKEALMAITLSFYSLNRLLAARGAVGTSGASDTFVSA